MHLFGNFKAFCAEFVVLKSWPGTIWISYLFQLDFSGMLAQSEMETGDPFLGIPHIYYLVVENQLGFTKETSCLKYLTGLKQISWDRGKRGHNLPGFWRLVYVTEAHVVSAGGLMGARELAVILCMKGWGGVQKGNVTSTGLFCWWPGKKYR